MDTMSNHKWPTIYTGVALLTVFCCFASVKAKGYSMRAFSAHNSKSRGGEPQPAAAVPTRTNASPNGAPPLPIMAAMYGLSNRNYAGKRIRRAPRHYSFADDWDPADDVVDLVRRDADNSVENLLRGLGGSYHADVQLDSRRAIHDGLIGQSGSSRDPLTAPPGAIPGFRKRRFWMLPGLHEKRRQAQERMLRRLLAKFQLDKEGQRLEPISSETFDESDE